MRSIVEAVIAAAILVTGGSAAVVATGALPESIDARARQVTDALGLGRVIPGDPAVARTADPSGAKRGFRGADTIVTARPVRRAPFTDLIRAVGTGMATESVTVAASVAGLVDTVHFTPNQLVAAGDPLVTLDREAEAIALEGARAQYAQAKAVNARYQAAGQRSTTFSLAEIEEVATALAVAGAALKQAEFEYDRRIIRAPFAGRVGMDELARGQHLAVGAEIVRLDDASALEVEFLVPEGQAADARTGTTVRAMSLALPGQVFDGEIVAIDSHIDPATRTLRVRARIPNPEDLLTPGMTFSITMPVEGEVMPVLPAQAVQWSRDGAHVWRIGGDGVERVPVVIAKREGDDVFVRAALDEGDIVAVEGADRLNAGSTVAVAPEPDPKRALTVEVPPLTIDPAPVAMRASITRVTE